MATQHSVATWQRILAALLSIGGIVATGLDVSRASQQSSLSVALALLGLYGAYLFGYVALRGELPKSLSPRK
ncbi:hypothetical protein [Lysobacter sp. HA35]